jgi:PAS domain S-box-containing protein
MKQSIRRNLWTAFGALLAFVVIAATLNILVLQHERRQQARTYQVYEQLVESLMMMDGSIASMLAAARAYSLTESPEFLSQYHEAIRNFDKTSAAAFQLARQARDREVVLGIREHFQELRELSDRQIELSESGRSGAAISTMLEAARKRRTAYDFAGTFIEREKIRRAEDMARLEALRIALSFLLISMSIAIIFVGVMTVFRIEKTLATSIARQVRRTEAIIAGMAEGVMLVDDDGSVTFINPAGARLLGTDQIGVSIEQQGERYGLRRLDGRHLEPQEIPAAQALSGGSEIADQMFLVNRPGGDRIVVSMDAVPLREEGKITGAIVGFRDATERRRLEQEMQAQAERAQILADASSFFSANIDPVWVTQAVVERVAEVLGDWAAIVTTSPDSKDLQVSAIYHREMASVGLAWAWIYRQPLVVGEGLLGQVVSSGYPSLTTNLDQADTPQSGTYHQVQMRLASLLILPLRTRREVLGALVIAAHDTDRQMDDQKLPLAEDLAERAALAIENARLYTDQVEARKKVEELSKLKDEFLSIASHELRTPVTSIKGYTQLAKTLIDDGDLRTSEQYLDVALNQIDRMTRLITELLDVSRIETGRLEIRRETIDWREFVEAVVNRQHAAHRDREFHLRLPEQSRQVLGDRDRLEQVLCNLLDNAIKYSPEARDVDIEVMDQGDRLITAVRDYGIGIPADELALVFERFHRGRQVSTNNYGGLGLGLYITRQIIDRHGGSIWVESREGEGTRFLFSLPAAAIESESVPLLEARRG